MSVASPSTPSKGRRLLFLPLSSANAQHADLLQSIPHHDAHIATQDVPSIVRRNTAMPKAARPAHMRYRSPRNTDWPRMFPMGYSYHSHYKSVAKRMAGKEGLFRRRNGRDYCGKRLLQNCSLLFEDPAVEEAYKWTLQLSVVNRAIVCLTAFCVFIVGFELIPELTFFLQHRAMLDELLMNVHAFRGLDALLLEKTCMVFVALQAVCFLVCIVLCCTLSTQSSHAVVQGGCISAMLCIGAKSFCRAGVIQARMTSIIAVPHGYMARACVELLLIILLLDHAFYCTTADGLPAHVTAVMLAVFLGVVQTRLLHSHYLWESWTTVILFTCAVIVSYCGAYSNERQQRLLFHVYAGRHTEDSGVSQGSATNKGSETVAASVLELLLSRLKAMSDIVTIVLDFIEDNTLTGWIQRNLTDILEIQEECVEIVTSTTTLNPAQRLTVCDTQVVDALGDYLHLFGMHLAIPQDVSSPKSVDSRTIICCDEDSSESMARPPPRVAPMFRHWPSRRRDSGAETGNKEASAAATTNERQRPRRRSLATVVFETTPQQESLSKHRASRSVRVNREENSFRGRDQDEYGSSVRNVPLLPTVRALSQGGSSSPRSPGHMTSKIMMGSGLRPHSVKKPLEGPRSSKQVSFAEEGTHPPHASGGPQQHSTADTALDTGGQKTVNQCSMSSKVRHRPSHKHRKVTLAGVEELRQTFKHVASELGREISLNLLTIHEKTANVLVFAGMTLFHDWVSNPGVPPQTVLNFLKEIQSRYNNVIYHNAAHAATVVHITVNLLNQLLLPQVLSRHMREAILVASAAHDVGHTGRTNNFFVDTRSPLALIYNDTAVLENYHCFVLISTIQRPSCNVFADITTREWKAVRATIIELIMATDMSRHFSYLSAFRLRNQSNDFAYPYSAEGDQVLVAKMALKAADIGHVGFERGLHYDWSLRLAEEFYAQGDEEKSLGMPITPLCDRSQSEKFSSGQPGFLNLVVLPLFQELETIDRLGGITDFIDQIEKNSNTWKCYAQATEQGNEMSSWMPRQESLHTLQQSGLSSSLYSSSSHETMRSSRSTILVHGTSCGALSSLNPSNTTTALDVRDSHSGTDQDD